MLTKFKLLIDKYIFRKQLTVLLRDACARGHAITWKFLESKHLKKLYLNTPNDGFKDLAEEIKSDGTQLIRDAQKKGVDFIIAGDEGCQIMGIVDISKKFGIKCVGVDKKWAQLEASKKFAKEFMIRNSIPTPKYRVISSIEELYPCIEEFSFPLVLKANGLASGLGVTIVENVKEAEEVLSDLIGGRFGENSKTVIGEEFIKGEEISLMTLWDGKTLLPLIPVRDYKSLYDGNKGPNTGGMGSYCPVNLTEQQNKELKEYLIKLEKALKKEGANFTGILFSGIIFGDNGLNVLEYNIRLGHPEANALLMHLDCDLLEIFDLLVRRKLHKAKLKWKKDTSICVVLAAKGYPGAINTDCEIKNINESKYGVKIFYNGVYKKDNGLYPLGGRVLYVCKNSDDAYDAVYKTLDEIDYKDKIYRRDIGF